MRLAVPVAINLLLTLLFSLVGVLFWVVAPLLPGDWIGAVLTLPVLLTLPGWALIHESFHGHLHTDRATNTRLGRLLAVLHGAPYPVLRQGHLLHHRFSRLCEMSETYDDRTQRHWQAMLPYYASILGGLYLGQLLTAVLVWFPGRARHAATFAFAGHNELTRHFVTLLDRPEQLRQARGDGLLIVLLIALSAGLYAAAGALPWLAGAVLARALLISFFDNAYHYGDPRGDARFARNHRLPAGLDRLILNFNYHGAHHVDPGVPWTALPEFSGSIDSGWQGGFVRQALRQLRGPIPLSRLPHAAPQPRDRALSA